MSLAGDQKALQKLLKGKTVKSVWRRKRKELGLEFADGTRLFIDWKKNQSLDLSVTGGTEEE
jgi:hypothetical protein